MKIKESKQICNSFKDVHYCASYPFCFDCNNCTISKEELQEVIDNYFSKTSYKVTIKREKLDEFEKELKDFVEICGGKFTNPNKEEIYAFIKDEATKLRKIWRKDEYSIDVEYNHAIDDGIYKDLDEFFINRLNAYKSNAPTSELTQQLISYANRIINRVFKDYHIFR